MGREQRLSINPVVDAALHEPGDASRVALLRLRRQVGTTALAERVRRRAAVLGHRMRKAARAIHGRRDELIEAIYAAATPPGCCSAWSDGSTRRDDHAGLGGIVLDRDGHRIASIQRTLEPMTPLATEIAALEAVLRVAHDHGVERLRLHTDCRALVELWRSAGEPALVRARALAQGFRKFELRVVPRLHNQPANMLARGRDGPGLGGI
jgi:ribonuclease HI